MTRPSMLALIVCAAGISVSAQNVPIVINRPVTVGAITRDAGVYGVWVGTNDLALKRRVNGSLINLESDLAGKLSSLHGVSYQDRTATAELLHEVHMTTGRDFDQTTGALRGLMGKLDFLVVIDAVDARTARMKLIDVETGSVKGVANCQGNNTACVNTLARSLAVAANAVSVTNSQLEAQRAEMMTIKPQWDDAVARYEAAKQYWDHIQSTIAGQGHSLRPEIRTLLNGSAKDVSTGVFAVRTLDVPTLKTATETLTDKLDKLDTYR